MEPKTEAGKALLGHDIRTAAEMAADGGRHSPGFEKLRRAILAIETEAAAGTALDVEALPEAIHALRRHSTRPYRLEDGAECPPCKRDAPWFAAEYARLAGVESHE